MGDFGQLKYYPDVLSCLANLSNDEVFTPPSIANKMLDLLPQELFSDPNTKFLDPCCKSGIFLREITKRLIKGLKDTYPDLQQRIDHILHEQVYGIAITELTSLMSRRSLYCSKYPSYKFSVSKFENPEGNIVFHGVHHTWGKNGNCIYCGANKEQWDRGEDKEKYAYEFIHTDRPEDIFKMKFDVIIGNPPYNMSDGGHSNSAVPLYQLFIENAKKLNPKYISMIIPSRWFCGGRGLDSFRKEMLSDDRIRVLVDYENFRDVFPGVDLAGGACYFLWNRDSRGKCRIVNSANNEKSTETERSLNEFDVLVRSNKAIDIVRKVVSKNSKFLDTVVSPSRPFGLRTYYKPVKKGIPCQFIQKYGLGYAKPEDVEDRFNLLGKWKFLVPRSPIAGQTDFKNTKIRFYYDGNSYIAPPGTCCTESLIVLFASDSKEEVLSFKSYIYTKITRFLLLQCMVSQDATREKFLFVPDLGHYKGKYTDEMLCQKWGITPSEWAYIDSKIASSYEEVK